MTRRVNHPRVIPPPRARGWLNAVAPLWRVAGVRQRQWVRLGLLVSLVCGLGLGAPMAHAGAVLGWGLNVYGEVGDGTSGSAANRLSPVPVLGVGGSGYLTGVKALAAGYEHSLALLSDGSVVAWGDDNLGELGNNAPGSEQATPVVVHGLNNVGTLSGVTAIAAGYQHSLALLSDGSVVAWGDDSKGQLGDNHTTYEQDTPVAVHGLNNSGTLGNVIAIAAGQYHNLALLNDGSVIGWGADNYGQLGDTTAVIERDYPVQVRAVSGSGYLTGVIAIAAGVQHSLALLSGGSVLAWGDNSNGQSGVGSTATTKNKRPVAVHGQNNVGTLSGASAISAGGYYALVMLTNGNVLAWGYNAYGQLGTGDTTQRNFPVAVNGPGGTGTLNGVSALAAGFQRSLALRSDSSVLAWGDNQYGELGTGDMTQQDNPVPVAGPSGTGTLSSISALGLGSNALHSLAVQSTATYVTLMSFTATRYSSVLWLNWQTGLETDNLGFNVYREMGGKKVRLNGNWLIAGSAIQTGANSGCTYAWPDALVPGAKYWLEDVDTSGVHTWHGPITPRPGLGSAGALRRSPLLGQ